MKTLYKVMTIAAVLVSSTVFADYNHNKGNDKHCPAPQVVPVTQINYTAKWQHYPLRELTYEHLNYYVGVGSDFYRADLRYTVNPPGKPLILAYTNFFNANLAYSTFMRSPVKQLTNAQRSNYQHAILVGANFGNADHTGSLFFDVNATNSKWDGALLANALWRNVNMTGVAFVTLKDGSYALRGVKLSQHPTFINAWRSVKGYNGVVVRQKIVKLSGRIGYGFVKI